MYGSGEVERFGGASGGGGDVVWYSIHIPKTKKQQPGREPTQRGWFKDSGFGICIYTKQNSKKKKTENKRRTHKKMKKLVLFLVVFVGFGMMLFCCL